MKTLKITIISLFLCLVTLFAANNALAAYADASATIYDFSVYYWSGQDWVSASVSYSNESTGAQALAKNNNENLSSYYNPASVTLSNINAPGSAGASASTPGSGYYGLTSFSGPLASSYSSAGDVHDTNWAKTSSSATYSSDFGITVAGVYKFVATGYLSSYGYATHLPTAYASSKGESYLKVHLDGDMFNHKVSDDSSNSKYGTDNPNGWEQGGSTYYEYLAGYLAEGATGSIELRVASMADASCAPVPLPPSLLLLAPGLLGLAGLRKRFSK